MGSKELKTVRGRILFVQEERFRLLSEKGQGYLFTLAHNASPAVEDLEAWAPPRWQTSTRP